MMTDLRTPVCAVVDGPVPTSAGIPASLALRAVLTVIKEGVHCQLCPGNGWSAAVTGAAAV
jgi:hypothetical protein